MPKARHRVQLWTHPCLTTPHVFSKGLSLHVWMTLILDCKRKLMKLLWCVRKEHHTSQLDRNGSSTRRLTSLIEIGALTVFMGVDELMLMVKSITQKTR